LSNIQQYDAIIALAGGVINVTHGGNLVLRQRRVNNSWRRSPMRGVTRIVLTPTSSTNNAVSKRDTVASTTVWYGA